MGEHDGNASPFPAGFVGRDEAARISGVGITAWNRFETQGKVSGGRWFTMPGGGRCRIYPIDEIRLGRSHAIFQTRGPTGLRRRKDEGALPRPRNSLCVALVHEPKEGFEPSTPALRKRCSAIELLRRRAVVHRFVRLASRRWPTGEADFNVGGGSLKGARRRRLHPCMIDDQRRRDERHAAGARDAE